MPSFALTPEQEKSILNELGFQSTSDLFVSIPPKIREKADFTFDPKEGLSEHELRVYFGELAQKNSRAKSHFLGGGVYDNIIPAIVNQLTLRGEFLTCYTPYQPEVSQGTLQVIFEFQTMITRLTGMEVANASMYDGATATAEAVLMAERVVGSGRELLVASSLNPEYQQVVESFVRCHAKLPHKVRWNEEGTLDLDHLTELVEKHRPYALVVPYPNYFGLIEPLDEIKQRLPEDCLLVVSVADLSALGMYEAPGVLGADIVAGEAQQLGTPMTFGGPHVGIFAAKRKDLRQMPGRLCGESVDVKGRRAYTLTLSTREQHIRREKATSNICTNQGLIALRTAIYLSFLGKRGFQRLADRNYSLYGYLKEAFENNGIPCHFPQGESYREGVFDVPNLEDRFKRALSHGIIPGIKLKDKFPGSSVESGLLICVNPKHTKKDLDRLVEVLSHG